MMLATCRASARCSTFTRAECASRQNRRRADGWFCRGKALRSTCGGARGMRRASLPVAARSSFVALRCGHPQLESGGRTPIVHRHADHAFVDVPELGNEFRRQPEKFVLLMRAKRHLVSAKCRGAQPRRRSAPPAGLALDAIGLPLP